MRFPLILSSVSLLVVVSCAKAQMSGDYTVGTLDSDFETFEEAMDSVESVGLIGDIRFLAEPGSYYDIPLDDVNHAHTITFESATGNWDDVEISAGLHDCTNITFRNVNISQASYVIDQYYAIELVYCRNITFDHCRMAGNYEVQHYRGPIIIKGTSIRFLHCHFENFYNAIDFSNHSYAGSSSQSGIHEIAYCTFVNIDEPIRLAGNTVGLGDPDYHLIHHNTISNCKRGIQITEYSNGDVNAVIDGNKISVGDTLPAIEIKYTEGGYDMHVIICNNFISGGKTDPYSYNGFSTTRVQSINIQDSENILVIHNSIHGGALINSSTNVHFYNNAVDGDTSSVYLNLLPESGHNSHYSINPYPAYLNGSWTHTEEEITDYIWEVNNSRWTDPGFFSADDLHSTSSFLDRAGAPYEIAGFDELPFDISVDIDGDPRDPLRPDIGADEFEALPDASFSYHCSGAFSMEFANDAFNADNSIWIFPGQEMTGDTVVFDFEAEGTYEVQHIVSNSIGTDDLTVTITVDIPDYEIELNGQYLTLPEGLASYEWMLSGGPLPDNNLNYFDPVFDGAYSCRYTAADGCIYETPLFFYSGIEKYSDREVPVRIYPNPASQYLIPEITEKNWNTVIKEATGKVIRSFFLSGGNAIDVSMLSPGIYIISFENKGSDEMHIGRFIKN